MVICLTKITVTFICLYFIILARPSHKQIHITMIVLSYNIHDVDNNADDVCHGSTTDAKIEFYTMDMIAGMISFGSWRLVAFLIIVALPTHKVYLHEVYFPISKVKTHCLPTSVSFLLRITS